MSTKTSASLHLSNSTIEEDGDIFDIEREEINLLDELMKEFECLWATYKGTFAKFIKRVWKPKVKSILNKAGLEDIYRETGVVLKRVELYDTYDHYPVSESEQETPDSEGTDSGSSDDELESASESGGHEEAPMPAPEEDAIPQQSL